MGLAQEQQYSVWHAKEEIIFTGTKIAHSSTEIATSLRWIEINVYRTRGGRYVVHRIGVSLVYHAHGVICRDPVTNKEINGVITKFSALKVNAEPCMICKPPWEADPDFIVDSETDRPTAVVCTASEVQDNLMVRPQKGAPFLSSPARRALDEAVANDPILADMLRKKVRMVE